MGVGWRVRSEGRAWLALARWLGPWASEEKAPAGGRREETVDIGEGRTPTRLWIYEPRSRPRGIYLVAPGLNFAGPSDPRADRFSRILAHAGFLVFAPFVEDYERMLLQPRAMEDFKRIFRCVMMRSPAGLPPPTVFSISFGSIIALALAGDPDLGPQVGKLLIFGGYRDWGDTLQFAMTGEVGGERRRGHDPLNLPVIMMHVLYTLPVDPVARRELATRWRAFCRETWGRPEMEANGAAHPTALRLADGLAPPDRLLFLKGCGVEPGARAMVRTALATTDFSFLDPSPHLAGIRAPVYLVHGREDKVIPYEQSVALWEAMPEAARARLYLTGLYGHTRTERRGIWTGIKGLGGEMRTLARILSALALSRSVETRIRTGFSD